MLLDVLLLPQFCQNFTSFSFHNSFQKLSKFNDVFILELRKFAKHSNRQLLLFSVPMSPLYYHSFQTDPQADLVRYSIPIYWGWFPENRFVPISMLVQMGEGWASPCAAARPPNSNLFFFDSCCVMRHFRLSVFSQAFDNAWSFRSCFFKVSRRKKGIPSRRPRLLDRKADTKSHFVLDF